MSEGGDDNMFCFSQTMDASLAERRVVASVWENVQQLLGRDELNTQAAVRSVLYQLAHGLRRRGLCSCRLEGCQPVVRTGNQDQ
jgi:hypothetical protein